MSLDEPELARLRQRTSEKWQRYGAQVLPAWVAEMDFPVSPAVRAALERSIGLDDYGYPMPEQEQRVAEAFAARMLQRYGWQADAGRVEVLSDVVQGLTLGLLAFTAPGDGVLVQTPIYPPFLSSVAATGRRLVTCPLADGGERYLLDADALAAAGSGVRALLLCHPHNPTGRVFERAELEAIAALAIERDWIVVSDEIHADLTYAEGAFTPFAALAPEVAARTVTLSSASKAFNIAGLRCAVVHFGSRALAQRFAGALPRHVRGGVGLLALHATLAAWQGGDPWLNEVKQQLDARRRFVLGALRRELPTARVYPPEATYLAWLDLRALGLGPRPAELFRREAGVALSDGAAFGAGFEGFVRLNFATGEALLGEIVGRLGAAVRRRSSGDAGADPR